ncbi:unnamed protein product [Didymodactylos carnosus]|uniref:Uncharacterized protein n=1 Tax=Didymodactylos carnosus TaxID=1234261 RepID=A0A815JN19_9BILA|nr:unnamed protein product [Didymodactylos carnosus]CAF4279312.1 unnamed protein product [Didymodactylos carnosus]
MLEENYTGLYSAASIIESETKEFKKLIQIDPISPYQQSLCEFTKDTINFGLEISKIPSIFNFLMALITHITVQPSTSYEWSYLYEIVLSTLGGEGSLRNERDFFVNVEEKGFFSLSWTLVKNVFYYLLTKFFNIQEAKVLYRKLLCEYQFKLLVGTFEEYRKLDVRDRVNRLKHQFLLHEMCNKVAYDVINEQEIKKEMITNYLFYVQQRIENSNLELYKEDKKEKFIKKISFRHNNFQELLSKDLKGLKFIQENASNFYAKTAEIHPRYCALLQLYRNSMTVLEQVRDNINFDDGYRVDRVIDRTFIDLVQLRIEQMFYSNLNDKNMLILYIEKSTCVDVWLWYEYLFSTSLTLFNLDEDKINQFLIEKQCVQNEKIIEGIQEKLILLVPHNLFTKAISTNKDPSTNKNGPFHNNHHLADAALDKLIADGFIRQDSWLMNAHKKTRISYMKTIVPQSQAERDNFEQNLKKYNVALQQYESVYETSSKPATTLLPPVARSFFGRHSEYVSELHKYESELNTEIEELLSNNEIEETNVNGEKRYILKASTSVFNVAAPAILSLSMCNSDINHDPARTGKSDLLHKYLRLTRLLLAENVLTTLSSARFSNETWAIAMFISMIKCYFCVIDPESSLCISVAEFLSTSASTMNAADSNVTIRLDQALSSVLPTTQSLSTITIGNNAPVVEPGVIAREIRPAAAKACSINI